MPKRKSTIGRKRPNALRMQKVRANETEHEHEERLKSQRNREESTDERNQRLDADAERKQIERQNETKFQRARRLDDQNERQNSLREKESPKSRNERLEKDKIWHREQPVGTSKEKWPKTLFVFPRYFNPKFVKFDYPTPDAHEKEGYYVCPLCPKEFIGKFGYEYNGFRRHGVFEHWKELGLPNPKSVAKKKAIIYQYPQHNTRTYEEIWNNPDSESLIASWE